MLSIPAPRWLKAMVFGMGILIIVLAAVVVSELLRRTFGGAPVVSTPTPDALSLPDGARIADLEAYGDQVLALIDLADGTQQLLLLDPADGTAIEWPLAAE